MEKKGKCRRRGAVRLQKIRYNRECLSTESIRFSSVPPPAPVGSRSFKRERRRLNVRFHRRAFFCAFENATPESQGATAAERESTSKISFRTLFRVVFSSRVLRRRNFAGRRTLLRKGQNNEL